MEMVFRKLRSFSELLEAGFWRAVKKGMRRSQTVTVEQMRAEYKSFAKTSEYCE
jgi:hypothetical protein